MFARLDATPPPQNADVIMRAVGAVALAALAMIHVIDLPGTLGPTPLIGAGYFGIIAAAVVTGGVMITRWHWLAWAAAAAPSFRAACPGVRPAPLTIPGPGRARRYTLLDPAWVSRAPGRRTAMR